MDTWEVYAMSMRKIPPALPYKISMLINALGACRFFVGNFKGHLLWGPGYKGAQGLYYTWAPPTLMT